MVRRYTSKRMVCLLSFAGGILKCFLPNASHFSVECATILEVRTLHLNDVQ